MWWTPSLFLFCSWRAPSTRRLGRLGFAEVALYGASAPQVSRRLLAGFAILEGQISLERVIVLEDLRAELERAVRHAVPTGFHELALVADRHGLG